MVIIVIINYLIVIIDILIRILKERFRVSCKKPMTLVIGVYQC